jgi:hypothetical protein
MSNIITELSFKEKWNISDVVILATVTRTDGNPRTNLSSTATARTMRVLKGMPGAEVVLRTWGGVPERNPRCCELGGTYVMFLTRHTDGKTYASVNGRFGLIKIGSEKRTPETEVIYEVPGTQY